MCTSCSELVKTKNCDSLEQNLGATVNLGSLSFFHICIKTLDFYFAFLKLESHFEVNNKDV